MGGDKGGGGDSGASAAAGQAALEQVALGRGLIEQVDPLRQALLNRGMSFLGMGGPVPYAIEGRTDNGLGPWGGKLIPDDRAFASQQGGVAPATIPGLPTTGTPLATRTSSGMPDMTALGQMNERLQSIPLDPSTGLPVTGATGRTGETIDLSGPGGGTVAGGDGKGGDTANIEPGGFDVTASPLFDPIFGAAQEQFNIANEAVLSSLPSGGALQEAIAENARRRAQTITGASADIAQQELANIMTLITGGTQQGIAGSGAGSSALSGLAGQQAMSQATESAGKNQMFGGFGSGVGSIIGGK